MVSFRQLIRNVPCLCASVAHVAIFWISGPFLWPFVVYFMLLLVIVFSTDSTNPDSLPIPLFIFFLSFLWMALFIFIASRILITYNGDSDSLLSPIDTIYSGHCIRCRRILMRSRLLRGWAKSLGSQSEVYAFHFDEEAFNIPSNSTGTNTNTNDESSSYASCSLCKLLISSLQSRRPNPKQIRRSEAETLLTSTSDGYGTLSGSRLTCSRKFEMEIFRERTSTFIRLHASNKSSPAFKVHTCKGERGVSAEAYQIEEIPPLLTCSTGSPKVVSLARSWINSCCKSHPECLPPAFYRPKRLVHIISATKASIILTDYAQIENSSYTALSHCWGKGVPLKLTRESEAILTQPFNITDLPPTFQDAVRFTSALGYSYIWIDSLCIIQDSPEDWAAQSILMSEIYAGAICTIAATDASDSQNGCFRDRSPLPEYSFECVLMGSPDAYAFIRTAGGEFPNIESLFSTSVENAPLNQRAWTFQERLLSGRVVHFCKSIVLFECHSMRTSELHPADGVHCERETWISYDAIVNKNESRKSRKLQPQYMRSFYGTAELMSSLGDRLVGKKLISRPTRLGIRGALNMLLSLTEELSLNDKIRCHQDWYELVAEYSRRDTTFRSDRLVALAGLATLISSKTGMNCVSGLWNATLPLDLLWVPMLTSQARPSTSIAPSWSWASVDGGVRSLFSDFFIGPDWNIKTKAMVNSVKAEYPCSTLPIAKHVELLVEGPMKMYKPDQLHSTFDFNDTPYDIELACLLIHSCSPGYMAYMEGGGQCLLLRHKESYEDHENAYERVGTVVIPSEEARPENGWETKVIILV